jgi:hypothetical protein
MAFIEVTLIKNNIKENRLINLSHIRQVLQYGNDDSKIKLDLVGYDEYITVELSLKDFKIILNNIK